MNENTQPPDSRKQALIDAVIGYGVFFSTIGEYKLLRRKYPGLPDEESISLVFAHFSEFRDAYVLRSVRNRRPTQGIQITPVRTSLDKMQPEEVKTVVKKRRQELFGKKRRLR